MTSKVMVKIIDAGGRDGSNQTHCQIVTRLHKGKWLPLWEILSTIDIPLSERPPSPGKSATLRTLSLSGPRYIREASAAAETRHFAESLHSRTWVFRLNIRSTVIGDPQSGQMCCGCVEERVDNSGLHGLNYLYYLVGLVR